MANEKINPSAMLSKELIIESLLDMLAVKPLNSISISEIAENAKVDRRTFYRHFKSKNDVISYCIHRVSKQYEEIILQYNINDTYSFAKAIFETLENMKEILQILYKQNLLDLFLTDFEIIYEKYQYKYTAPEILNLENIDYIMTYWRGGFTNIVKKWIIDGCLYSPNKMGKIFNQMFSLMKEMHDS
ncbi:MAG: TetR/AcrR family transcriptional regulator [Treponema sp.]|nr:TetR/AcrR family transcriptional regulator [Treponema sp.]